MFSMFNKILALTSVAVLTVSAFAFAVTASDTATVSIDSGDFQYVIFEVETTITDSWTDGQIDNTTDPIGGDQSASAIAYDYLLQGLNTSTGAVATGSLTLGFTSASELTLPDEGVTVTVTGGLATDAALLNDDGANDGSASLASAVTLENITSPVEDTDGSFALTFNWNTTDGYDINAGTYTGDLILTLSGVSNQSGL